MWPEGRTTQYAVWRACERLGIRPPGVKESWDDHAVEMQSIILAYDQVASHDESEWEASVAGVQMTKKLSEL